MKSGPIVFWLPPPPTGVYKLNFDGLPGPSGFGCMVHDSQGEVISIIVLGPSFNAWKYVNLICEIWDLVVSLSISLSHVPRFQYALADKIAKWVVELANVFRSNVMLDIPA